MARKANRPKATRGYQGNADGSVMPGWCSPMNIIPPAGGKNDPVGSATYPPAPAAPKDPGYMPSRGGRGK